MAQSNAVASEHSSATHRGTHATTEAMHLGQLSVLHIVDLPRQAVAGTHCRGFVVSSVHSTATLGVSLGNTLQSGGAQELCPSDVLVLATVWEEVVVHVYTLHEAFFAPVIPLLFVYQIQMRSQQYQTLIAASILSLNVGLLISCIS